MPDSTLKPRAAYGVVRAARPFSLSVSLVCCAIGTTLALKLGYGSVPLALLVVFAGVLLQVSVNLINDHADLPILRKALGSGELEEQNALRYAIKSIGRNFKLGLVCLAIALSIGLCLVWWRGWPLLLLILVGLLAAYFYSGEPIHYKRRGLGVFMAFLFMGVLLVAGAAMAMGAPLGYEILLAGAPMGFLAALLLLSNELRDHDQDARNGLRTLTVRIGVTWARRLFVALLVLVYLSALLPWWIGQLGMIWPLILSIPWAVSVMRHALRPAGKSPLLLKVGNFFWIFGVLYWFLSCCV